MRLRKLQTKDAPLMLEWMHDDFVVHDLRTDFASKTIEDCMSFIVASQDDTKNLHLAIVDDNDEYMGTVSLKHIYNASAEFGITIRKCAMGNGFSHYGMMEIIRLGNEKKGLKKIYWCVAPNNLRAVRFYDKNNYKRIIAPNESQGYSDEEKKRYIWYGVEA